MVYQGRNWKALPSITAMPLHVPPPPGSVPSIGAHCGVRVLTTQHIYLILSEPEERWENEKVMRKKDPHPII